MNKKKNNLDELLSVQDIASIFNIPPVTIQRWVYQGKIPYKIQGNDYYFKRKNVYEWAKLHDFKIKEKVNIPKRNSSNFKLSEAIKKGGIYLNIPGKNVYKVLENCIQELSFLKSNEKVEIFNQIINREEMASTGIGNGIAVPHTRNRFDLDITDSTIPVFFLKNEIDFNSIDKQPVYLLFMMFTTSAQSHLKMLAKISYLVQNNSFREYKEYIDKELFLKNIISSEK